MPGPGIQITIAGNDRGVQRMLHALDTAMNPIAIAGFLGAEVDPYLRGRARNRFDQEGDDVVGGWAPLKTATENIRSQLGFGAAHPINVRTTELEDYITDSPNNIDMAPWGASITLPGNPPNNQELATKVSRAQQGDARTVARPVLGMNERDLAAILLLLAHHVKSAGGRTLP